MIALACALAYWGWVALSWREVARHAIDVYAQVHTPPAPAPAKAPVTLPANIMSVVYEQQEEWAQESVAARARELWDELQDWGMVSHQLEQEMGTP